MSVLEVAYCPLDRTVWTKEAIEHGKLRSGGEDIHLIAISQH